MHSGMSSASSRPKSSATIAGGTSRTFAAPSPASSPARTTAVSAAWFCSAGVDSLNSTFGQPVVQTKLGGKGGGAANLTEFGDELVSRYRSMEKKAGKAIAADLDVLDAACRAKAE